MQYFDTETIRRQIDGILQAWGMPDGPRKGAVDVMVETDLRGIDSHGISMLPIYDERRKQKSIRYDVQPVQVLDLPNIASFDAQGSLGHPASLMATDFIIERAATHGLAAAAVHHSNHFGAAGIYVEKAARAGLVAMAFSSVTEPSVVPTHAAQAMFGTNPLAFAAPGKDNLFLFDMATSTVAMGKIKLAHLNHRPIPVGWAVNENGEPETNATVAQRMRMLTPLGGTPEMSSHKGYGLAVMVEIMSSMLTGALYCGTRRQRHPDLAMPNIGHFFLAINPRAFRPEGGFEEDLDDMIEALRNARRADPDTPVLVAGDKEYKSRAKRVEEGIPLAEDLIGQIRDICRDSDAEFLLNYPIRSA